MKARPIARIAAPIAGLVAAGMALGCSSDPEVSTVEVHGTAADHGRALFSDPAASPSPLNRYSCATCHRAGAPAAGDARILSGAPLAGAPLRPTYWGGQENDLLRAINDCRYYFMSAQKPWAADDEDAEAMYAYLVSLPEEAVDAAPFTVVQAAKDLPAGDTEVGRQVFERACQACHGAVHTGEGRLTPLAPAIPDQTVAEHAQYTATEGRVVFVEKIRHGAFLGYEGSMPPFSLEVLSDDEIAGLLAYFNLYP